MLSLLHNLCNPIQTFLYYVKDNLVLLYFGYRKRRMLSVLLKMACYLHLVPTLFWKVPPTPYRGTSTSWRNWKEPHEVQKEVQSPASMKRTTPCISICWGPPIWEGPGKSWWMLYWTWASNVPLLQWRLMVLWVALGGALPAGDTSPLVSTGEATPGVMCPSLGSTGQDAWTYWGEFSKGSNR